MNELPKARLHLKDSCYELPVYQGTEGEIGIDIGSLRAMSGATIFLEYWQVLHLFFLYWL